MPGPEAHRVDGTNRISDGTVRCASCGRIRELTLNYVGRPGRVESTPMYEYPKGWLLGAAGWFCCEEHIK